MKLSRLQILLLSAAVLLLMSPPRLWGDEDDKTSWPSEQEQRLQQIDSQLLDVQQKLHAARQKGDAGEIERLSNEFKDRQAEHLSLLRATGQLPPPED